jgi:trigger factor
LTLTETDQADYSIGAPLVKVTTEKLPKSLLALEIELEHAEVEKGLDRAARRISQKYNIPGFRKGKAPRFIVENYFGRPALIEEASEDLVNRSFREALEKENIDPVGRGNLESMNFEEEPYSFRVVVPVPPTVTLPDYRSIQVPVEPSEITDETVSLAMDERRERHVVLREPEEQHPAQQGDQLTVQLESFVDGKRLEELTGDDDVDDDDDEFDEFDDDEFDDDDEEDDDEDNANDRDDDEDEEDNERDEDTEDAEKPDRVVPDSTLVMEPTRIVAGLYEGLLGITPGETREVTVTMPEDHPNAQIQGKDVTFKVTLKSLQERLLPDWDELPVLEEFEGTLDELREKTREELIETARNQAEREAINAYVDLVVADTEYDIPDAMIAQEADRLLHEQGRQYERYGITLEQMLQFRGQTHDEAVETLKPQAEERLRTTLALREIVRAEGLSINDDEIDAEVVRVVETYTEEEREMARNLLSTQLRATVASGVLNQKLNQRLIALATGAAPALTATDNDTEAEAPASESEADTPDEENALERVATGEAPEPISQVSDVKE